jgi:hypothetical protein
MASGIEEIEKITSSIVCMYAQLSREVLMIEGSAAGRDNCRFEI